MKNFKLLLIGILLSTSFTMFAQQTVKGIVKEKTTGEPLPGVSIIVKGTTRGTESDFTGNFTLNRLKAEDILVFTYIGFLDKEITIGTNQNLIIELEESAEELDEIVLVGYGFQKKSRILGNTVRVNGDEIKDVPVPSVEAALQGKASGVQVIQGSGLAGAANIVRIRGISSISAGGDPLYVIDGIPITQDYFIAGDTNGQNNNPLASLNQNDIESIEVLKDAAAAGIYGSRGANGVILIKTKRGKNGLRFSFNSSTSISAPTFELGIMNNTQLLEIYQEAWENDGNVGLVALPNNVSWTDALNTNTDWVDLVTKTGVSTRNAFSVNYGTDKLKVYANVSYDDTESFVINDEYQRISGRLNIDYNILESLKIGLNTSLSKGIYKQVDINNTWRNSQSFLLPFYSPYQANGDFENFFPNPLIEINYRDRRNEEVRTINAAFIEFKPTENLFIRGTAAIDYMDFRSFYWQSREIDRLNGVPLTERNTNASVTPTFTNNYNTNITASYLLDLNEKNSLNFLLGTEYQRSQAQFFKFVDTSNNNLGILNSDVPLYKSNAPDYEREYTGKSTFSFASYFGRINYTFDNKLDLMALARLDGSSRFGENNRYGFFPTFSAAYNFTNDSFIKNSNLISFLKLKTSYGITGNSAIGNESRFGSYSIPNSSTVYLGQPYQSINSLENPDLKWETAQTFDVSLEMNFLENRVETELSAYYKRSKDVLLDLFQIPSAGYDGTLWVNSAIIENKGLEFNLTSENIVTDNFSWSTNFNISHNTNKLISLGGASTDLLEGGFNDTRVTEGEPIGTNFLVRFARVDPADGLPIFLDLEGNETKTFDLANRVAAGSVIPDAVGGFGTKFKYKNWGLNADFVFTIGGNIYDGFAKRALGTFADGNNNTTNVRTDIYDRWRNPGDITNQPRLFYSPSQISGLSSAWQYNHTGYLYDASYLRMRNIAVNYSLPNKYLDNSPLNSLVFTLSGSNLFTWTKYPGGDPEIARDFQYQRDRNLSPNVSYLSVPQARTFTLNINATF